MTKIFLIGIGGFIGTLARYCSQLLINKIFTSRLPLATLLVNLAGCFLIGLFFSLSEKNVINNDIKIILTVGFCGGFTTFSSFALENYNLIKSDNIIYMLIYSGLSMLLGLFCVALGIWLGKSC